MRFFRRALFCAALLQSVACAVSSRASQFPDLYEASIVELQDGLERGDFSSVDLVKVSSHARLLVAIAEIYVYDN